MNRLLCANFARLKKDRVFWLGMLFMAGYGAFIMVGNYMDSLRYGEKFYIDDAFFSYAIIVGITSAVFCCLFLGTEYSEGTIRNKLMVGHTRGRIYLANLIVCTAAGLLMTLAFLITAAGIGIPLFGLFHTKPETVLAILAGTLLMVIAFTSVFTFLSMMIQNKAIAAITVVMTVFILLFTAIYLSSALNSPEMYEGYSYTDDDGNVVEQEAQPNPAYVSGTKRQVYEALMDILPTGQSLQYSSMSAVHLWQLPLYSVIITIVTTGAGIIVFRQKDIK